MTEYPALALDQLIRESFHYWPLENERDIKEVKAKLWGYSSNVTTVRGIQDTSLVNKEENGYLLLGDNKKAFYRVKHPHHVDTRITISLWLKHYNKNQLQEQTFFTTGNKHGLKIFQYNGTFDHIAFQVTWSTSYCVSVITASTGVWSHLVFVWDPLLENITIYYNGKLVQQYLSKGCYMEKTDESNGQVIVGDSNTGKLPSAALDEILIWLRMLSDIEVENIYHYYKGFVFILFARNR